MTVLALINGAPGSGKSTVAALVAERRSRTVALDLDVVKHASEAWPAQPVEAGLQARRLALATADRHLRGGVDVVIGQYLARTDFIEELERLARRRAVPFVEVLLDLDAAVLAGRIEQRRRHPDRAEHAVNGRLVDPQDAAELLASLAHVRSARPGTVVLDATGSAEDVTHAVSALLDVATPG